MDDFPPSVAGFRSPAPARDDASMSSDGLPPPENPNEILTVAPKERFRLGYFDVMCLVMNRMIGKSSRACVWHCRVEARASLFLSRFWRTRRKRKKIN